MNIAKHTFTLQGIFNFFGFHKARIFVYLLSLTTGLCLVNLYFHKEIATLQSLENKLKQSEENALNELIPNFQALSLKATVTQQKPSLKEALSALKKDLQTPFFQNILQFLLFYFILYFIIMGFAVEAASIIYYNKKWSETSFFKVLKTSSWFLLFVVSVVALILISGALAILLFNNIMKIPALTYPTLFVLLFILFRWALRRNLWSVIYADRPLSFTESLNYSASLTQGKIWKMIGCMLVINILFALLPLAILKAFFPSISVYLPNSHFLNSATSFLALFSIYKQLETGVIPSEISK